MLVLNLSVNIRTIMFECVCVVQGGKHDKLATEKIGIMQEEPEKNFSKLTSLTISLIFLCKL